ncbi:MAG: hypothetical protein KatS3mg059_1346 [Thermomicrobiales bacterium]|nr:MAG: hypothetical protein KatS3mg059_1346 [Thermomicrobiales bacterium]
MTSTHASPAIAPNTEPEAAGSPGQQVMAELGRLRERLAAYERLDTQLEAMIAQLTELLRGSLQLRRRTHAEISSALARCEALLNADRDAQQHFLQTLSADIAQLYQRATITGVTANLLQAHLAELAAQLAENGHDGDVSPESRADGIPSQR